MYHDLFCSCSFPIPGPQHSRSDRRSWMLIPHRVTLAKTAFWGPGERFVWWGPKFLQLMSPPLPGRQKGPTSHKGLPHWFRGLLESISQLFRDYSWKWLKLQGPGPERPLWRFVHTPLTLTVSEAWGWRGKSLLMQALEHPHTLSSRRAGPSHFPSISLSIAPPDLVTGCSCPLPLIDPSAQAHPCQVSASPQRSEASPKLLHLAQARHRCGWRARPRL